MKILCFSDSHGKSDYMLSALSSHQDCELVIFLGDGLSDFERILSRLGNRAWLAVRGNCDREFVCSERIIKKTDSITLCGKKIVFTHGDLYGVKYSNAGLMSLAKEEGGDIVLFGHTHNPTERYVSVDGRGVYLFNPGSVGESIPSKASFGIITLNGKEPLFSHGRIKPHYSFDS